MDEHSNILHLVKSDLVGIKEFFSNGGDILKPLPGPNGTQTLLENIICSYDKLLNNSRDEIILYLIGEEVKVRCAKNLWNDFRWIQYLWVALSNCCSDKIILTLIHTGSANIVYFGVVLRFVFIAVEQNFNAEILSTLLKYCSENELKESYNLLIYAVACNRGTDIIKLFFDVASNFDDDCDEEHSLFYFIACKNCNGKNCKSKHIIDFLVKNGVDLQVLDSDLNTIIHKTNCGYLIQSAIKNGISIEQKNERGFTPLLMAILSREVDKVNLLLQFGADPSSGLVLYLEWSFFVGRERTYLKENSIDLLLYHGADLHKTVEDNSSLDLLSIFNIFTVDLMKVVNHYIFFMEQNDLYNYFPQLSDSGMNLFLSFLEKCEIEINNMKNVFVSDGLTLYDFCNLKRCYNSKFINISVSEFTFIYKNIDKIFPIYSKFIDIRIKDNMHKRQNKFLCDILQNVYISPKNKLTEASQSSDHVLDYDCLYYITKFLNTKDLYNLFLASISD